MKFFKYKKNITTLLAIAMLSLVASVGATIVDARWLESKDGKQVVLLFGDCHAMIDQSDIADRRQLAIIKENLYKVVEKKQNLPVTFLVEGRTLGSLSYFPDTKLSDIYETCPALRSMKNKEFKNYNGWGILLSDLQRLGERLDQDNEQFNACMTETARIDFMNLTAVCISLLQFQLRILGHIIAKEDPWIYRTLFQDSSVCSDFNHCKELKRVVQQEIFSKISNKIFQKTLHKVRSACYESLSHIDNMGFSNISSELLEGIEKGQKKFKALLQEVFDCDLAELMKKDQSNFLDLADNYLFNCKYLKKAVIEEKIKKIADLKARFLSKISKDIAPFLDTILVEKTLCANQQDQQNLVIIFAGFLHTKGIAERYLKDSYVQKKYVQAEGNKKLSCHIFDWISAATNDLTSKNEDELNIQQVKDYFPYNFESGIVGASIIKYQDKKILFLAMEEVIDAESNNLRQLKLLEDKSKQLESYEGLSVEVTPLSKSYFSDASAILDKLNMILGNCELFSDELPILNDKWKIENSFKYLSKLNNIFDKYVTRKPFLDRYLEDHSEDMNAFFGLIVALFGHQFKLLNIIMHSKKTKLNCDCFYKINGKNEDGCFMTIMSGEHEMKTLYPVKGKNYINLTCSSHGSMKLWLPLCVNNCNLFSISDLKKIFCKYLDSNKTIADICRFMKRELKKNVGILKQLGFRSKAKKIRESFSEKFKAFENCLAIIYGEDWPKMTLQNILEIIEKEACDFEKCTSEIKRNFKDSIRNRLQSLLGLFTLFVNSIRCSCVMQDIFQDLQDNKNKVLLVVGARGLHLNLFENFLTERFSVGKTEGSKSHIFFGDGFAKSLKCDDSLDPESIEKMFQEAFKEKSVSNEESKT